MTYSYYIGIDISKDFFDVVIHNDEKNSMRFENTPKGHDNFIKAYKRKLPESLVVLEATGGYETRLIYFLAKQKVRVHRADPTKSSSFIKSLGQRAKTDTNDAKGLARYGFERHDRLSVFKPLTREQNLLSSFLARRDDLISMRTQERNRAKHPNYSDTIFSVNETLNFLDKQLNLLDKKIQDIIDGNQVLAKKAELLTQVKGVGKQTAYTIIGLMPELGELTRRQAASLAGCAPHPKDSGKKSGYRSTYGGRQQIKRSLFMAAMSARNFNPTLKKYYDNLIKKGKKPIVALTAIMRKLITILNAILRDYKLDFNHGR